MADTKTANLRKFFADAVNSTTRERIFFNRLSFDLKIAAARQDYHLHLYEPDVDRSGFDIVVEDEDRVGWFQTKAVLSSASTSSWEIPVRFLRPALDFAESYGFDPVEAGRGGGVILIEIDDSTVNGDVKYRYTDFDILAAIAERYIIEEKWSGRGRPASPAQSEASAIIESLRALPPDEAVWLPKQVFVTASGPDTLLGLMGLRSSDGYGMYTTRNAYRGITIDAVGAPSGPHDVEGEANLHSHMELLCAAQAAQQAKGSKVIRFKPFTRRPPPAWDL